MGVSDGRNTVVGSMIWKFLERMLQQGVSFIVSLVLARILFPEDYGTIALVQVFINLAAVFINSGFATALIQKKDATDVDFSTMFYCSLICSIAIYLLVFCVAPLVANFYKQEILCSLLRVFAVQIPLGVYNAIQNAYIARNMMFRKQFVSSLITVVISGIIGILMAMGGFGVWALVVQSISAILINTVVMMFYVPWHPRWQFSKESAKGLMKYGSRILGADLSGTFFGEVRSLIIGRVYSSTDLAFYNKGQQLPALVNTNLTSTVIAVMFPALARRSDNLEEIRRMTKLSTQVLAFIVTPVVLGLAAVMEPLIEFMYTSKWLQCVFYGQIMCIGYAIGQLGIIPLQVLKAIGRSDVVLRLEVIKKPAYVVLLIAGVAISVKGLAIAMLVYDIYGTIVNLCQMKKHINYEYKDQIRDYGPTMLLGTLMCIVVICIPPIGSLFITLVVKVIAGVMLYMSGAVLLKLNAYTYLKELLLERLGK